MQGMQEGQGCWRCRVLGVALLIACFVISVQLILPGVITHGHSTDVRLVTDSTQARHAYSLPRYPVMGVVEDIDPPTATRAAVLVQQSSCEQVGPRWVF